MKIDDFKNSHIYQPAEMFDPTKSIMRGDPRLKKFKEQINSRLELENTQSRLIIYKYFLRISYHKNVEVGTV